MIQEQRTVKASRGKVSDRNNKVATRFYLRASERTSVYSYGSKTKATLFLNVLYRLYFNKSYLKI